MEVGFEVGSMLPFAVSVEVAASLVGMSRAAFYPLVMSRDVPSFKVGRRRLVLVAGLKEWVEHRAYESEADD